MANSPVTTPTTPNINLYNGGSEWQNLLNNMPDYNQTFYRNYDPAIGRFIAVDPMPESVESLNVYQYAGNNPVMMNDPMGNLLDPARLSHPANNPPIIPAPNPNAWGNDGPGNDDDPNWMNDGAFGDSGEFNNGGAGASFSSWDEIAETVMDLFNSDNGGTSFGYRHEFKFGSENGALLYGFGEYQANGGTQSFAQVLYNYGADYTTAAMASGIGAGPMTASLTGGTPDSYDDSQEASNGNLTTYNNLYGQFVVAYNILTIWREYGNTGKYLLQSGATFQIGFQANSNADFVSYQWVQTAQYADMAGHAPYECFIDNGGEPQIYYYNDKQLQNSIAQGAQIGLNAYFTDYAHSPYANNFNAEAMLIGFAKNGSASIIASFSWGYTTLGFGYTYPLPVIYHNTQQ